MSGIKNMLFQMMEDDHEIAKRRRELFEEPDDEAKAMAVYDHVRSDEVDSMEVLESEDYAE